MNDVIPHGEIHEVQITEKNLYAVDELLADTIYEHDFAIADFRKKLTMPSGLSRPNLLACFYSDIGRQERDT